MTIAVRNEFIGSFGGGVKRYRVIHAFMLTEWHGGIGTIYAAATSIYKVWRLVVSTGLNDVGKSNNVTFHIGVWVNQ